MKAVFLLRRAADFLRRADMKGVESPREEEMFRSLDESLTSLMSVSIDFQVRSVNN